MPTYQYKREDGTVFEVMQKMSDAALSTCPETGQSVKRVISGGSGVLYKGDGWYVTDYKKKESKPASTSETSSSTTTDTSTKKETPKAESKEPAKA